MAAIADKPVEMANLTKHCDQRRKYPVLLRVEFQVFLLSLSVKSLKYELDPYSIVLLLFRLPARWKATQLGTVPSRRIDQKTRTKKSFPVSGGFYSFHDANKPK